MNFSKITSPSIIIWVICILLIYLLFIRNTNMTDLIPENAEVNNIVDAVVYVSMGKMAYNNLVDFSIASVRKIGKWDKNIYVLTDIPICFENAKLKYNVIPIYVPKLNSIMEIKSLKTTVFEHLPLNIHNILYLDIDILVAKPLKGFLRDLSTQIITRNNNLQNKNINMTHSITDIALFPDAKGHYVGFCSGCEKWHTGIIWYKRHQATHATNKCMKNWKNIILSGKFDTDQQSMDVTDAAGHCPHMISLLTKHLIFAKDYIAMTLLDKPTFWHVTGAGRPEEQDWFYSTWILPRLYYSLHPPLNPKILNTPKKCNIQ